MKRSGVHLTYCSNIHPGERWSDVDANLRDALPRLRTLLAADDAFGIGLRLSAAAALALEQPPHLQAFLAFLSDGNYYVPTINGFPYGAFHRTRVKEQVYQPDWRSRERVDYTNRLARLLAAMAVERGETQASISTVPCAFRPDVRSQTDVDAITANLLDHAACLVELRARTGVSIALAIEAEPACHLETTTETIDFIRTELLDSTRIAAAGARNGSTLREEDVRRHIGLCLDACHMAVEFEDPEAAVAAVLAAGLRIVKVQLSSALRVGDRSAAASPRELLGRFADDTYLHQVVVSDDSGLTRYTDLPEALVAADASTALRSAEWRVHFHVPIFLERMSGFDTTQRYLASLISVLKRTRSCDCLEIETYTWDVLPQEYRTTDVCTAIARELTWAQAELER